eukprot:3353838-Rhodomonas_salina.1
MPARVVLTLLGGGGVFVFDFAVLSPDIKAPNQGRDQGTRRLRGTWALGSGGRGHTGVRQDGRHQQRGPRRRARYGKREPSPGRGHQMSEPWRCRSPMSEPWEAVAVRSESATDEARGAGVPARDDVCGQGQEEVQPLRRTEVPARWTL